MPRQPTLEPATGLVTMPRMKFVSACLIWLLVSAVLGFGLWKYSHGSSIWFLLVPTLAFLVFVGKVAYKSH